VRVILRSYADWCSYNEIFVNDEYTRPIRESVASGASPLRVLDLGANFGYFALKLADVFLQERPSDELVVWMVEASPTVCAELRHRMESSQARMKWTVTHGLVGKRTGTARLNIAREDNQNFVGQPDGSGAGGTLEVRYVDLAALVGDAPVIDLIKCDIEGSEFDLIESYPDLLARTTRLVVEFHRKFGDVTQATDRLKDLGFLSPVVLRDDDTSPVFYFSRGHAHPGSGTAPRRPS
jgi:FkbM family methyltransferase